jgi:pantothenate kinase
MDSTKELAASLISAVKSVSPGARFILGITGYPAAGKSTLAEELVRRVNAAFAPEAPAIVVPMDGFHLSNTRLAEMNLLELKGIPETFDAIAFVELLERLRSTSDKNVYAPLFDRSVEASIEDAIVVKPTHKLCVIEGNYILLQTEPWQRCKQVCDQIWFIDSTFETILPRLKARHIAGGRSEAAVVQKVESTDLPNARLIEQCRMLADRIVTWRSEV